MRTLDAMHGYIPQSAPDPVPELDDEPFWTACAHRRLIFQRCASCGLFRHPPSPYCPHCRSPEFRWGDAPSTGQIFSYTIVHHPMHESVADAVPYNVVLVEFRDCDDVRLITNIVDAAPEELEIGLEVHLTWDAPGAAMSLPRFRCAS